MNRRNYTLISFLALFGTFLHAEEGKTKAPAVVPVAGQQVAQEFVTTNADGSKNTLQYWCYLPKDTTAASSQKFPLLLFLHGSGERGTELEKVKKHGPPGIIGKNADMDGCIIISPQCSAKTWWNAQQLKDLCDDVAKHTPVDPSRRYLTGLSMGGFGSWDLLAAFPTYWAAAVPICGKGKPETAAKFKSVPIWVFHGAKDPAVPLQGSQEMVTALEAAGGKPKFTIYPEEGHESWTPAYKDAALWKWLREQKLPEGK